MTDSVVIGALTFVCVALVGWRGGWRLMGAPGAHPRPVRPERLGPTDQLIADLDGIARRVRGGDSLTSALDGVDWRPLEGGRVGGDVTVAKHAVTLAAGVGGQVAATIDSAAATLRARQAVREEIAAHSAQARLSIRVLTVVPLVVAGWTATSSNGRAALGSSAGVACVALGALLNGAGWLWMRALVRSAER